MQNRLAVLVATGGIGLIPPLTIRCLGISKVQLAAVWGTIAAAFLCYAALQMGQWTYVVIGLLVALLGWLSIPLAEEHLGPRVDYRGKTRSHDQNEIVIDELLGMLVAVYPLFWFDGSRVLGLSIALAAFGIFDSTKIIPPCRSFDNMKSVVGVMLDDVFAGLYAAIVLSVFCIFNA